MADPLIDPADLRGVRFPGSFRRYDARAVDDFLESVAQRVEATNDLVERLRAELGEKQAETGASSAVTVLRAEVVEEPPSPFDDASPADASVVEPEPEPTPEPAEPAPDLSVMSDEELTRLVGEETAHVLGTARSAASEIRSKAEESAARLIRESTTEAKQLTDAAREEADALVAEARTSRDDAVREAEAEADTLRSDAEAHAERVKTTAEADVAAAVERAEAIRTEADEAATRLRADAESEAERILEEARTEGRSMLAEAKQVRARVLTDLQRRRDLARDQVDRLLAGRDRLLAAYAAVRSNVDDVTAQFDGAVVEAGEPVANLDETIATAVAEAEHATADLRAAQDHEDDEDDDVVDPWATTAGDEDAEDADAEGDAAGDEVADEVDADAAVEEEAAAVDDTAVEADAEDGAADASTGDDDDDDALEATDDSPPAAADDDQDGPAEEDPDVDALFARIRAERAQSVARAQEVLGEGDQADAGAVPTSGGEAGDEVGDQGDSDDATSDDGAAGDEADLVPAELRADDERYGVRAEVLDAVDKKLTRAMKRRLADEQNRVLDALRKQGSTAFGDVVPGEDEHLGSYAKVAATHLGAAASAGADSVAEGVAVDVDDLADELGRTLIEPFRRRIERATEDVDSDADALDDRLRALYREWKVEHIGPAVTDALVAAYSAGQVAAALERGHLRWLIEPGSKACPDCHDNALAGAIEPGSAFPTDVAHPPAHPGCRCLLVVDV